MDFGSNVSRRQSGLSSAASTGSSSNSEVEGNRDKKAGANREVGMGPSHVTRDTFLGTKKGLLQGHLFGQVVEL